jgi:hypothetical protein
MESAGRLADIMTVAWWCDKEHDSPAPPAGRQGGNPQDDAKGKTKDQLTIRFHDYPIIIYLGFCRKVDRCLRKRPHQIDMRPT